MDNKLKPLKFETGWEDCGYASVLELICTCGNDILKGDESLAVSDEEIIKCSVCGSKYQFVWKGMTVKKIEEGGTHEIQT